MAPMGWQVLAGLIIPPVRLVISFGVQSNMPVAPFRAAAQKPLFSRTAAG